MVAFKTEIIVPLTGLNKRDTCKVLSTESGLQYIDKGWELLLLFRECCLQSKEMRDMKHFASFKAQQKCHG